jgi:hypothetical protein
MTTGCGMEGPETLAMGNWSTRTATASGIDMSGSHISDAEEADIARQRDEVIKRMLATPPQPKKPKERKKNPTA